jgi:hypothetical protein
MEAKPLYTPPVRTADWKSLDGLRRNLLTCSLTFALLFTLGIQPRDTRWLHALEIRGIEQSEHRSDRNKKERTILMGEEASKSDRKPLSYYLKLKCGGLGGALGKVDRQGKSPVQLKWRAGRYKGTLGASRMRRPNKLSGKSRSGFRFEVKF